MLLLLLTKQKCIKYAVFCKRVYTMVDESINRKRLVAVENYTNRQPHKINIYLKIVSILRIHIDNIMKYEIIITSTCTNIYSYNVPTVNCVVWVCTLISIHCSRLHSYKFKIIIGKSKNNTQPTAALWPNRKRAVSHPFCSLCLQSHVYNIYNYIGLPVKSERKITRIIDT